MVLLVGTGCRGGCPTDELISGGDIETVGEEGKGGDGEGNVCVPFDGGEEVIGGDPTGGEVGRETDGGVGIGGGGEPSSGGELSGGFTNGGGGELEGNRGVEFAGGGGGTIGEEGGGDTSTGEGDIVTGGDGVGGGDCSDGGGDTTGGRGEGKEVGG